MLQILSIRNLSLVEETSIEFGHGLNIITGETGAGKSILIGALALLLGEKSPSGVLRDATDKAVIEGSFKIKMTPSVQGFFETHDIPQEDGDLILRREILKSGRTRTFVNDSPVAAEVLQQLSELLVDLHGQHEHQSLLRNRTHVFFLDAFGSLDSLRQQVGEQYRLLRSIEAELDEAQRVQRESEEKHELYVFQLNEIESLNPQNDEDVIMEGEEKLLASGEKRFELASKLSAQLYENEGSVQAQITSATQLLRELAGADPALNELRSELENAHVAVSEIAKSIENYSRHVDIDPTRLESVRQRLGDLQRLKKKYGGSLQSLLQRRDELREAVNNRSTLEERINSLSAKMLQAKDELLQKSMVLSEARQHAAKKLEEHIPPLLGELGMPAVSFQVKSEHAQETDGQPRFSAEGIDQIEFLFSANPGRAVAPLAKIASGGEISRVMLALKSVLAEKDSMPVIVFDEIDSGVSGRIAQAVGKKLHQLAKSHQVICVTHLPQIASAGEHHFLVEKSVKKEQTRTQVRKLQNAERPEAIARLLGGETISETHLQSARELLVEAGFVGNEERKTNNQKRKT